MSKTYILEPVELTFVILDETEVGSVAAAQITTQFEINPDGLNELRLSIDDDVFICYGVDAINDFLVFTPDGSSEGTPAINLSATYVVLGPTELEGTHTVAMYTGEDDPEPEPSNGLPDKNITYEYKNTTQNDIEDIIQAIYSRLEEVEEPTNGHSPADRLVVAVAVYFGIDPEVALTMGNYPNQMKRIAAIIRGDFLEEEQAIFG